MKVVTPEQVGFSTTRLGRIGRLMEHYVAEQKLAGVMTLVARSPGRFAGDLDDPINAQWVLSNSIAISHINLSRDIIGINVMSKSYPQISQINAD